MLLLWTVFLLALARYCWGRRRLYLAAWKLDGPITLPIIGSTFPFIFCKTEELLEKIYEIIKTHKNPTKFWLGPRLVIIFKEPRHVEKIMTSSKFSHKHEIYDLMKDFLGEGLITASGPTYKLHKKIVQPYLSLDFSEECIKVFERHIQICCQKLEQEVGRDSFDIGHKIHLCTADIIGDVILGHHFDSQNRHNLDYIQGFSDVYKIVFARLAKPWLHPDAIFNTSLLGKEYRRISDLSGELRKIVLENSHKRRKSGQESQLLITPIVDLLSEYVESNPGVISPEDLWSHLISLYMASEDTIALIVSAACLCLGLYPEYQAKLYQEIQSNLGNNTENLRASDLSTLPYMDMCIKDVLRLFPIGPYIFRRNVEDQQVDTHFLPENCGICIPIFNLHRNPKFWQNPDHFHPDHFLPEAERGRHPYSYIPFSAGPRGCVGKVFANVSVKVMLINLLQRFEFTAEGQFPDVKLTMDISVRSLHGYRVRIKRRNC